MRARIVSLLTASTCLALAGASLAHVERASYFPDPAPDTAVKPAAGGKVPKVRSLASALNRKAVGDTRVVCKANSMKLLNASIAKARKSGYDIRPTDHRRFSAKQARRLRAVNRRLFKQCRFHEIQPAVIASHNNDRVVIMPGLYTEPTARKAPTHDKSCDQYRVLNDRGQPTALSYEYHLHCPNDQNLIAVMGRDKGPGKDPERPRPERYGIPNLGPCIRCNLQIEGSGVSADDVIVDGGRVKSGNKGPIGAKKDVGFRADRADGFVLRNVTVRHVAEHDIYVTETDGYVLDRFKVYYAGEYGVLTFVGDHGLMQNCDAAGHGDSALYPGSGAETGKQRPNQDQPFRLNQEIRWCDMHHNTLGYSGTDANAIHVHDNNFYDNSMGFSTDIFTAAGHPGFPQDSDLIENNNFYDNNFNSYAENSDVEPSVPVPVGTAGWIAGGNDNIVRNNKMWNNWRRGWMLFSVPDAFVCPQKDEENLHGCDPAKVSTAYNNSFYGNLMGVAPDGSYQPNGEDFWWDNMAGNTGNCWWANKTAEGKSLNNKPAIPGLPECNGGKDPGSSTGTGSPDQQAELIGCLAVIEQGMENAKPGANGCTWFDDPPKPSR
ncbi:MAG TPA: right-handed parallel beta-helix repeat-containing protein [Nonomuraea sp.]|nr:right-handed parallel beta-helix repeat-containing protein [Nonomuraea sp.]